MVRPGLRCHPRMSRYDNAAGPTIPFVKCLPLLEDRSNLALTLNQSRTSGRHGQARCPAVLCGERFDDVAAGWPVTEFGRKVRAVPRHDSCFSSHPNDSKAGGLHRAKMRPMAEDLIVSDPQILGGKPCVRGTRLSVELLLELAASGATQEQILTQYPQLTADGLAAAFRYAADVLKGEHTWELRITA